MSNGSARAKREMRERARIKSFDERETKVFCFV